MDLNGLIKTTAFCKNEAIYLEEIADVNRAIPEVTDALLVGSMAGKFYISPNYKGRISKVTDLDFCFDKIPLSLKERLIKDYLTDWLSVVYYSYGRDEVEIKSDYPVYRITDYPNVDVFDGSIGRIKLGDYVRGESVSIKTENEEITVNVAEPGFLIATYINPASLTKQRGDRGNMIVDSLRRDFPEKLERAFSICRQTLKDSMVTKREFAAVKEQFSQIYRKRNPFYVEFVGALI